jgi:peptide/nickel transport system permease protein
MPDADLASTDDAGAPRLGDLAQLGEGGLSGGDEGPSGGEAGRSGSVARLVLRVFLENKLAIVAAVFLVLMVLFCYLGPVFYRTDQEYSTLNTVLPPGGSHPLGTDGFGFDVLGRLMKAGQSSLAVGVTAALLATVIGVLWGAIAGFFGGVVDAIMMRVVDIVLSIPILLLLIVLSALFSPGKYVLIVIIASASWLVPARLVRGETLTLRTREYVQAVRVMGGRGARIVGRHIVPNAIGTIIVNATFQVADAILFLAALGFLNLGIKPPDTDWGSMLSDGSNNLLSGAWWLIIPAGACIVLVVMAINFIGDALRDGFEVRLQQR